MMNKLLYLHRTLIMFCLVSLCDSWKAIPANQAMYALRSGQTGLSDENKEEIADEDLPRDSLQHIYKFGWCRADAVVRQYFRKSVNITFPTRQSTQLTYIYLLARQHTINYNLQCIVMKAYVPAKFLFYKSRLPLYYCQGVVFVLMLNTINKYEIHEFFLYRKLNMPINFNFEFYHPTAL